MVALAYDRAGSGDPLVLVHGLASARTTWRSLLPALAERYDVIAVDLPGHGDSAPLSRPNPRPRHASPGTSPVSSTSWGSTGRTSWAARSAAGSGSSWRPTAGRVRAPVSRRRACGESPAPAGTRCCSSTAGWPCRPSRPSRCCCSRVSFAAVGFASGSARPAEIPYETALDAARAQVRATGYLAAMDGTLGIAFDRAGAIGADVPVTAVFGDRDRILPGPRLQEQSLLPEHARWVVLPHCGHAPHWDAPGAVLRELARTAAAAG